MKITKKIVTLLTLFVSFFSVAQDRDFSVSEIPPELLEDANSVVRFKNVSIEIESQGSLVYTVEAAVTVLNKLADDFADITINYDKRTKINTVKAYIYDAYGKEVDKINKGDFEDYSAFDGISIFHDNRMLHYEHTSKGYPYTIQYKYQYTTSNTAFIPSWIYNSSFNKSIQESKFTITHPLGITLFTSEKHFDGFNVEKLENENSLTYKVANVKSLKKEPYMPSLYNYMPMVKFGVNKFNLEGVNGEATNWQEFGSWYYKNLIAGGFELSSGTKQKILSLTSNAKTPVEKAKIIYEYVQNKVRYISVQVGIGGFKPMLAVDVDNLGYGDCKGLTNYTMALLNAVDIKSYHTLIYGGRNSRNIDKVLASQQGNHMILNLPTSEGDIWLECTHQKIPFGFLGDFTDDRDVLVITPEGGVIKHTKIYSVEDNLQYSKGAYEIDEKGSIKATLKITSKGTQYDDNLNRYDGESQEDLEKSFKNYFSHINNIKFSNIEVSNNKEEVAFEEEVVFEASSYAIVSGTEMLIPINAFNRNTSTPSRVRSRKLPFELNSNYVDIDEVEIKLPTNLSVVYIPLSKTIETKFGMYSVEISKVNEHTYTYKRKIKITKGKYTKDEYSLYRTFKKNIKKIDSQKIILKIE